MPNKMERFTGRARRVLDLAQQEAEQMHHAYIGTEHMLVALLMESSGVAGKALSELGLEYRAVAHGHGGGTRCLDHGQLRELIDHASGYPDHQCRESNAIDQRGGETVERGRHNQLIGVVAVHGILLRHEEIRDRECIATGSTQTDRVPDVVDLRHGAREQRGAIKRTTVGSQRP